MAIYELGVSFQQGWGVNKNKETAFYYFEIAANLGDLDAMNDIAFCYTHGHGVKKNIFKAAQYYRMASRQGQGQVGNSWIWKDKYNIVEEPDWEKKVTI
jgi:TPR repeat protein